MQLGGCLLLIGFYVKVCRSACGHHQKSFTFKSQLEVTDKRVTAQHAMHAGLARAFALSLALCSIDKLPRSHTKLFGSLCNCRSNQCCIWDCVPAQSSSVMKGQEHSYRCSPRLPLPPGADRPLFHSVREGQGKAS